MSQENVEIVEQLIAAWNRRDLQEILSLTDPEVEYVNGPQAIEPGTRYGHPGLTEVFRKQWEGLGADARQHLDRTHPDGAQVITTGRMSRRLPGSSAQIENRNVLRWTFRDGRLIRLELLGAGSGFTGALEAVGLEE